MRKHDNVLSLFYLIYMITTSIQKISFIACFVWKKLKVRGQINKNYHERLE